MPVAFSLNNLCWVEYCLFHASWYSIQCIRMDMLIRFSTGYVLLIIHDAWHLWPTNRWWTLLCFLGSAQEEFYGSILRLLGYCLSEWRTHMESPSCLPIPLSRLVFASTFIIITNFRWSRHYFSRWQYHSPHSWGHLARQKIFEAKLSSCHQPWLLGTCICVDNSELRSTAIFWRFNLKSAYDLVLTRLC